MKKEKLLEKCPTCKADLVYYGHPLKPLCLNCEAEKVLKAKLPEKLEQIKKELI